MVPAGGEFDVTSGGESAIWTAVPGDKAGIAGARVPGAGTRFPGAAARVLEDGAKVILFGGECCQLAGGVIDPLQKRGAVRGRTNVRERRLGCDLGDAVRTAGCRVQAVLRLAGEDGLKVGCSRLDQMVWRKSSGTSEGEASELPQKLGRLAVPHLECEELADALLSRGGQSLHELGPQCGVGVLFGRGGDNVL
jgi:hypothetical protein